MHLKNRRDEGRLEIGNYLRRYSATYSPLGLFCRLPAWPESTQFFVLFRRFLKRFSHLRTHIIRLKKHPNKNLWSLQYFLYKKPLLKVA